MSDEPIHDDFDGYYAFIEDPRIETMIRQAGTITDLVLNAEFLLGEWVTDFLKTCPEIHEMASHVGLTSEQRCRLVIWYTGMGVDLDDTDRTFAFLLRVCQARSNLGRVTAQRLLGDLSAAYVHICRPDVVEEDALARDLFPSVRCAVAGHLAYANAYLVNEGVPSPDEDYGEDED